MFKDISTPLALLQKKRYVTYVMTGASQSNVKGVITMIDALINALNKNYSQSVAFCTPNIRALVDVVTISFYRMEDMVAVFDKSKKGIGIEIYLTNSVWKSNEIVEKSAAYRFLFSKSKENLFTIDGEQIKRSSDMNTGSAIEILKLNIQHHLPTSLEEPKKSKSKKEHSNASISSNDLVL
jgi:hypothetical protein